MKRIIYGALIFLGKYQIVSVNRVRMLLDDLRRSSAVPFPLAQVPA